METRTHCDVLSDTNYGSNYNEIFENNDPELNRQTPDIDKLDIYSNNKTYSKTNYENKTNKLFNNMFVNSIG